MQCAQRSEKHRVSFSTGFRTLTTPACVFYFLGIQIPRGRKEGRIVGAAGKTAAPNRRGASYQRHRRAPSLQCRTHNLSRSVIKLNLAAWNTNLFFKEINNLGFYKMTREGGLLNVVPPKIFCLKKKMRCCCWLHPSGPCVPRGRFNPIKVLLCFIPSRGASYSLEITPGRSQKPGGFSLQPP